MQEAGVAIYPMVRAPLGVAHGDPPVLARRLGERAVDEEAAVGVLQGGEHLCR